MRLNDDDAPAQADKSLFEIMMEMTAEEWDALGEDSDGETGQE